MLQKMYTDNPDSQRRRVPQDDTVNRLKPKEIDFLFYWRALGNNKWPIMLFVALVTAAAYFIVRSATPVYSADATLLLDAQKANIIAIDDLVTIEEKSNDYYGTQFAILRSRALAERVIEQLEIGEQLSPEQFMTLFAQSNVAQLTGGFTNTVKSGLDKLSALVDGDSPALDASGESTIEAATVGTLRERALVSRQHEAEFNAILKQFRQSLRVIPVDKTKLVTIRFESTDPDFAALAANTTANEYIKSVLEQRSELKSSASGWMDTRIQELRSELDDSEAALLAFKIENDLVDIEGGVARLSEQELLFQNAELAEARDNLLTARDLLLKVEQYKASAPQLLQSLPFVQSDLLVRSVSSELTEARRDLRELGNRYGSKHPKMADAQARLSSLQSTLNGHIDRLVATYENDYELLQQRVSSLEDRVANDKGSIQLIGQQKFTLEALEREVATNRDQYNKLYDRITEIRMAEGLDEAQAVLTEVAWSPSEPARPNRPLLVALAGLLAFLLAALVACVREYLDDTVNSVDDVERRLKTRLLGALPLVGRRVGRQGMSTPIIPAEVGESSDNFIEAVNACRTALLMSEEEKAKVILVTSSVPDEGKSTVALNLAYTLGQLERTLLIDCDLRRPSIAKALGLPRIATGVSTLVENRTSDCIRHNVLDSFDCLTSGPTPDKPLEMLSSKEFSDMLETLRDQYDRIIIDSAPLHVVSDALVLSKLADSVLYVVKPHDTTMKVIHNGLSRLTEAGASIAGICLSQLDITRIKARGSLEFHGFGLNRYGYGKYYRYGRKSSARMSQAAS